MTRLVISLLTIVVTVALVVPSFHNVLTSGWIGNDHALAAPGVGGRAASDPPLVLQDESWAAAIYDGSCADYEEDPVFELDDVEMRDDEPGAPATAVLTSYNASIDVELGELIDEAFAIGVGDGSGDGPGFVACGEIGQEGDDDERFVGLRAQHGSGVAGIARLRPNEDDSTQITLYVAAGLIAETARADDETATATAAPDAEVHFEKATPVPNVATPVAEGTPGSLPSPKSDDGEALEAAETYESPNYGYTVTYDAAVWSVEDAQIIEDDGGYPVDVLVLSNGLTTAELLARFGTLDALSCIDGLAEEMESTAGVTDFAPRAAPSGTPIAGGDEADAFAAFDYAREEGGANAQVTAFVNCRVMSDGEALLLVFLTALAQDYGGEEENRNGLLVGIELPGGE